MKRRATACGKIILSGEYAVLFGYPGIAVPAPLKMTATFEEDPSTNDVTVHWKELEGKPEWQEYLKQIISQCGRFGGTLTIENTIPLGKGLGASTALVIATSRALLGEDCEKKAREIEDAVNPGHSGIDFAVIWNETPVKFVKGSDPEPIDLPEDLLDGALLIDTGTPKQQTPELIAYVTNLRNGNQQDSTTANEALEEIGACTERLKSKHLRDVIRDHNQAQQSLGVVTEEAKKLITKIEQEGGSAKVLGAGARTGGCGMVLALNVDASTISDAYPTIPLTQAS